MKMSELPETKVYAELIIYGYEEDEEKEAIAEVKQLIENGLRIQGISGTRLLRVYTKR